MYAEIVRLSPRAPHLVNSWKEPNGTSTIASEHVASCFLGEYFSITVTVMIFDIASPGEIRNRYRNRLFRCVSWWWYCTLEWVESPCVRYECETNTDVMT